MYDISWQEMNVCFKLITSAMFFIFLTLLQPNWKLPGNLLGKKSTK